MIAVIQRVTSASVTINEQVTGMIDRGLLVLLGIEASDDADDIDWLARKIINLRIFNDSEGVMNLSLNDVAGELLLVSQFTLQASTKKGNRPSYIKAARPEVAIPIYEAFIEQMKLLSGRSVQTGSFGADMQVQLTNDGPVTLIIDSKNKR